MLQLQVISISVILPKQAEDRTIKLIYMQF